jgi:sugar lactone lactonase YvrE
MKQLAHAMNWKALPLPACSLAESPRYAHGGWMWLDINKRAMYRLNQQDIFNPQASNLLTLNLPDQIACILPTQHANVLVALGRKGGWLIEKNLDQNDQAITCKLKLLAPFDSVKHRFNDGRADTMGRIWISTLVDARAPATASLFCIESGKAEVKVPSLIVGNGLAFSPKCDAMFLCDTRHKCIWRFDFNVVTGELSGQKLIMEYTDGTARPDGACFSEDGSYWVAILEGYRLDRFSEEGEFIESIALPMAKPTMPCFGGELGNVLLVCSAQADQKFPNKPGFENVNLIACKTEFKGLPEHYANPNNLLC